MGEVEDHKNWNQKDFQIDRFGLDVKESKDGIGAKILNMISGPAKPAIACQVRIPPIFSHFFII